MAKTLIVIYFLYPNLETRNRKGNMLLEDQAFLLLSPHRVPLPSPAGQCRQPLYKYIEKKDKERGKDGALMAGEGGLDPTRRQLRNFRPLPH